jgi:hypothetical protein
MKKIILLAAIVAGAAFITTATAQYRQENFSYGDRAVYNHHGNGLHKGWYKHERYNRERRGSDWNEENEGRRDGSDIYRGNRRTGRVFDDIFINRNGRNRGCDNGAWEDDKDYRHNGNWNNRHGHDDDGDD